MSNKFLIGLKWFSIAILLIFGVAILTSFISDTSTRHCTQTGIGWVIGMVCMSNYLMEA